MISVQFYTGDHCGFGVVPDPALGRLPPDISIVPRILVPGTRVVIKIDNTGRSNRQRDLEIAMNSGSVGAWV